MGIIKGTTELIIIKTRKREGFKKILLPPRFI